MDNSQSEQDQKEELASLYSDITKSIYGVRLSIDPNDYTLEEMQAELDALDGREYIYKDEDEHYSLLDSYEEEQKAREPGEHTHDFFDTMDFNKDKAKLRNTSSFKENRKPKMSTKTITKSQLRQMIKEAVLKEQSGTSYRPNKNGKMKPDFSRPEDSEFEFQNFSNEEFIKLFNYFVNLGIFSKEELLNKKKLNSILSQLSPKQKTTLLKHEHALMEAVEAIEIMFIENSTFREPPNHQPW